MLNGSRVLIATAAATVSLASTASAHTPHDVVHKLQEHGYSRIEFVNSTPPNYMANACRNGTRYHFHVDYYGQVTERREIGSCGYRHGDGYGNDSNRRHRWSNWRNY